MKKIIFFITFNFILLTFNSHPALAQSTIGLSAIPPRLEVTVKAGGTITKEIKVRNESKVERTIRISIKDFIVTDDLGTPIQLDDTSTDQTKNRWTASNWIQVSPSQVKLKPGETKSLMLTVLPPLNALPGGHYAMVLHSPSNEVTLSETGATIQTNVGTLVYITIPGLIKQNAQVREFTAPKFLEYGPVEFDSIIANLSDIHITPAGSVNITNWFGGSTAKLALDQINIFPNTTREFTNLLDRKWLFGRYKAQLLAAYGTNGQTISATIFFWVIPWRLIILVSIALLISLVLIYLLNKRTPRTPKNSQEKVEELEEELEQLKQKYKDRK